MSEQIQQNAAVKNGVTLDKLTEKGPRGGLVITWRAAYKRDLGGYWHHSQLAATRGATTDAHKAFVAGADGVWRA